MIVSSSSPRSYDSVVLLLLLIIFSVFVVHTNGTIGDTTHYCGKSMATWSTCTAGAACTTSTPCFNTPRGLTTNHVAKHLYLAVQFDHKVYRIAPGTGGTLTTYAGSTNGNTLGALTTTKFDNPLYVDYSSEKQGMFVTDYGNNRITYLDVVAATSSVYVGGSSSGDDVNTLATATKLSGPHQSNFFNSRLHVVDKNNQKIKRVSDTTKYVTLLTTSTAPRAVVAFRSAVFIGEEPRIMRVDWVTGVSLVFLGTSTTGDALSPNPQFKVVASLSVDIARGAMYIAEEENHKVKKYAISTGLVALAVGSGGSTYDGTGVVSASVADVPKPWSTTVCDNFLYITVQGFNMVTKSEIANAVFVQYVKTKSETRTKEKPVTLSPSMGTREIDISLSSSMDALAATLRSPSEERLLTISQSVDQQKTRTLTRTLNIHASSTLSNSPEGPRKTVSSSLSTDQYLVAKSSTASRITNGKKAWTRSASDSGIGHVSVTITKSKPKRFSKTVNKWASFEGNIPTGTLSKVRSQERAMFTSSKTRKVSKSRSSEKNIPTISVSKRKKSKSLSEERGIATGSRSRRVSQDNVFPTATLSKRVRRKTKTISREKSATLMSASKRNTQDKGFPTATLSKQKKFSKTRSSEKNIPTISVSKRGITLDKRNPTATLTKNRNFLKTKTSSREKDLIPTRSISKRVLQRRTTTPSDSQERPRFLTPSQSKKRVRSKTLTIENKLKNVTATKSILKNRARSKSVSSEIFRMKTTDMTWSREGGEMMNLTRTMSASPTKNLLMLFLGESIVLKEGTDSFTYLCAGYCSYPITILNPDVVWSPSVTNMTFRIVTDSNNNQTLMFYLGGLKASQRVNTTIELLPSYFIPPPRNGFTIIVMFPALPQEVVLRNDPDVVATTTTTNVLTVASSLTVASAAGATQAGKTSMLIRMMICPDPNEVTLDFMSSPVAENIGDEFNVRVYLGALVENTYISVAVVFCHFGSAVLWACKRWYMEGSTEPFHVFLTNVRFPSLSLVAFMFFYQTQVTASLYIVVNSKNSGHRVLAAVLGVFWVGLVLGLTGYTILFRFKAEWRDIKDHEADKDENIDNVVLQSLANAINTHGKWVDAKVLGESSSGFCRRYRSLFEDFVPGRHWFTAVDVGFVTLLGVVASYEMETFTECVVLNITVTTIFLAYLVIAIWLRPYNNKLGWYFFLGSGMFQFLAAIQIVFAILLDQESTITSGVLPCILINSIILLLKLMIQVVLMLNIVYRKVTGSYIPKVTRNNITHSADIDGLEEHLENEASALIELKEVDIYVPSPHHHNHNHVETPPAETVDFLQSEDTPPTTAVVPSNEDPLHEWLSFMESQQHRTKNAHHHEEVKVAPPPLPPRLPPVGAVVAGAAQPPTKRALTAVKAVKSAPGGFRKPGGKYNIDL
eukprot:PhF_6_TR25509/c0_g1_i3/m.35590